MGHGTYSVMESVSRSAKLYSMKSTDEIFVNRSLDILMKPENTIRECRDSEDHKETIPIILALDITGSMSYVPDRFIREEMTKMMGGLYASGLTDAQVLFMGIGDHECDRAPLQVGQFEADDQLMDKWLKNIYLERGGGGNEGESYLLAWYYAAKHTSLDSFEKRGKKGFLFTIGDEPNLQSLPKDALKEIFGANGTYKDVSAQELYEEASKMYHIYHLHVLETAAGKRGDAQDQWKQNLNDHVIFLQSYKEIASVIQTIVKENSVSKPVSDMEQSPSVTEDTML